MEDKERRMKGEEETEKNKKHQKSERRLLLSYSFHTSKA
jgi:hypothetical protein